LPSRLLLLHCEGADITELPELPSGLKKLYCDETPLTKLPELPMSLKNLRVDSEYMIEPYKTFVKEYNRFIDHPQINIALNKLREDINTYLNPPKWEGFTQSDISKLDTIFEDNAENYALCPICLKYVERSEACMYMKHNCTDTPGYYHKALYEKYKTDEGFIGWCTICGRISRGHRHYTLSSYPALMSSGDPFEKDCRLTSGGGGIPEKLARFRRFREYALELQDDIGKKNKNYALNELVEEVFIAPFPRQEKLLTKIQRTKEWNIPLSAFPPNVLPEESTGNAPNIPFEGSLPTLIQNGRNNIMMNDNIEVLQFHHTQEDGTIEHHGIATETLEGFIDGKNKDFGTPEFGYCFMYPVVCKSKLYPQEIKGHVPDELYEDYRKKFNTKFKAVRGGGPNILQEATNAVCVNPKKRGGRRTMRRRAPKTRKMKFLKKRKTRRN
jgi:hypothetical protein